MLVGYNQITRLVELGDPAWFKEIDKAPSPIQSQTADSSAPIRVTLAPMPEGRTRGLSRMAPSRHESSRHLVSLSDVMGTEDDQALTMG